MEVLVDLYGLRENKQGWIVGLEKLLLLLVLALELGLLFPSNWLKKD